MKILILLLTCWYLYPLRKHNIETWLSAIKDYDNIDIKLLVGANFENYSGDSNFVICPVDDRYGAATYKVWCGMQYAHYNNYDLVIKVDDDLPVKDFHHVYDWIVQNYNRNLYAGLSCDSSNFEMNWNGNQHYSKRVQNESYPIIRNKQQLCRPIGGSFYMLGSNLIKNVATNADYLLNRREDNGISCLNKDVKRICPHEFQKSLDMKNSWVLETSNIVQKQETSDIYEDFYKALPVLTLKKNKVLIAVRTCHQCLRQRNIQQFIQIPGVIFYLGYNPKYLNNTNLLLQGYVQFPVDDRYYAITYKTYDIIRYALHYGYEGLVTIDDDVEITDVENFYEWSQQISEFTYEGQVGEMNTIRRISDSEYVKRRYPFRLPFQHPNVNVKKSYSYGWIYKLGKANLIKIKEDVSYLREIQEDVGIGNVVGEHLKLITIPGISLNKVFGSML